MIWFVYTFAYLVGSRKDTQDFVGACRYYDVAAQRIEHVHGIDLNIIKYMLSEKGNQYKIITLFFKNFHVMPYIVVLFYNQ